MPYIGASVNSVNMNYLFLNQYNVRIYLFEPAIWKQTLYRVVRADELRKETYFKRMSVECFINLQEDGEWLILY